MIPYNNIVWIMKIWIYAGYSVVLSELFFAVKFSDKVMRLEIENLNCALRCSNEDLLIRDSNACWIHSMRNQDVKTFLYLSASYSLK